MTLKIKLFLTGLLIVTNVYSQTKNRELRILQFNIWQEGTVVPGGFEAVIDEVIRVEADLIALSEVRNYNDKSFAKKLVQALGKRGFTYYSIRSNDTGILSRYPILSQEALFPVKNDQGSITKAVISIEGTEIAFYSAHLDYRNCSLYLPRGYDGSTWEKLDKAVTDTAVIAADNLNSQRDEAIDTFIADMQQERNKNRQIILSGDFNEPSHLDWIDTTKDKFDHNGVIMLWRNTLALEKAGLKDAYRKLYPDPVTHPGFTFPASNTLVDIEKLVWAPEADDRDRIDYIFYQPSNKLFLKDVKIIGPRNSIVKNQRKVEYTQDPIDQPSGVWPTDHKAVMAIFDLYY